MVLFVQLFECKSDFVNPENPPKKAKQIRETLQKDPTRRARASPLIPFLQTLQKRNYSPLVLRALS